jgi:hypothetical protein
MSDPAEFRRRVLAAGFSPLPLIGKQPILKDWQKHDGVSELEINSWTKRYPLATNTGILTARVPVLDLDIIDLEAAVAVEALVRERFEETGFVPVRFGRFPKRAIPFRTDAPFAKITAPLIAPGGSEGQRLEFLCAGQQLAIAGLHPDTGQPYNWHGGAPGDIKREDLAYIHEEEARALVDDAVELLVHDFGYRRPEKAKKAKTDGQGNGAADWGEYLANLADHDTLAAFAMALLRSGMSDGATTNFLRTQVEALTNIEPDRKARRLREIPGMVASAQEKLDAEAAPSEPAPANAPPFSDEALALTFAERHARELRYVAQWGQWLSWAGTHWRPDTTLHAFDLARAIAREKASTCKQKRTAIPLASAKTVAAVERLAKADRRMAAADDQWDGRSTAFNTPARGG